jgi:hypothetical protein
MPTKQKSYKNSNGEWDFKTLFDGNVHYVGGLGFLETKQFKSTIYQLVKRRNLSLEMYWSYDKSAWHIRAYEDY